MRRLAATLWVCVFAGGCEKVPIVDIRAGFSLANVSWFQAEQTLFVFYQVTAEQGIGAESEIELAYETDFDEMPYTALSDLTPVHSHLAVSCGANSLCGSFSLQVSREPKWVDLRLRYNRRGQVFLAAEPDFVSVYSGNAAASRSLWVYGVFDETNRYVQWRARHHIPNLRNEDVQALGLRRRFRVEQPTYGVNEPLLNSAYGYAYANECPVDFTSHDSPPLETFERAIFDPNQLPLTASTSGVVCAKASVTDATGVFSAAAIARKNPEVRPAYPTMHNPVHEQRIVSVLLRPCQRTLSQVHLDMQKQRLLMSDESTYCIDDWPIQGFDARLAGWLRLRIAEARQEGHDMVLSIVLHHDDTTGALALLIEQALSIVLPTERDSVSPRVSGAFVFDTTSHGIADAALRHLVLWCPSPDIAQGDCQLRPDMPDLPLGPVKFNSLPILPSRKQYEKFIATYTEAQAGRVTELRYLAPERTTNSQNFQVGDFGVATFFDNETFHAEASDAFSYCAPSGAGDGGVLLPDGGILEVFSTDQIVFKTPDLTEAGSISALPDSHAANPRAKQYELGVLWQFPFLMRMKYESVLAGSLSALSLTVPFGFTRPNESLYGLGLWEASDIALEKVLVQCTRFCNHPTFNAAGEYAVLEVFDSRYRTDCYVPIFPQVNAVDGGFPRDP